jgi:ribosomal protein L40E
MVTYLGRRTYPGFPWFLILLVMLLFVSGITDSILSEPFTLTSIMGSLFGLGGILLIIVLSEIKKRSDAQRIVEAALEAHRRGRIPVADFAEEVEFTEKSTRRVITDLRTKGLTQAYFDSKSGDIVFGKEPEVAAEIPAARRQPNFCKYCGARLPSEARFCTNCGASVE